MTATATRNGHKRESLAATTPVSEVPETDAVELQTILLPQQVRRRYLVGIIGETPLIAHRFGEDAKEAIRLAQSGEAKLKRGPRNPEREFEQARYRLPDGGDGFPAAGLKKAMTIAGMREAGEKKAELRGRISITAELLHIETPNPPEMRVDNVKLSGIGHVASLAYRPAYWPWRMTVPFSFNAQTMSIAQLLNILEQTGSSVSIGDWRVDCDGIFGQFRVDFDAIQPVN